MHVLYHMQLTAHAVVEDALRHNAELLALLGAAVESFDIKSSAYAPAAELKTKLAV